jgi:hypothetical protein
VDLLGFDSAYGFAVMLIVGAAIYLGIAILIVLFEFTAALAIEQQEKEEKQFHEAEINALKQRKRNSVAQVTGAFKPGAALKRQSSRRASTVKSPMEEALAILRPLAKTKAEGGSENDQQSKAINKALDIIASSASFNVNEEMLLRHALSYMRDNDTDVSAFIDGVGRTQRDISMPNWGDLGAQAEPSFVAANLHHRRGSNHHNRRNDNGMHLSDPRGSTPQPQKSIPMHLMDEVELDWDYDVLQLDEASHGHALSILFLHLLDERNLVDPLGLDRPKLLAFVATIEKEYGSNPYHSHAHGADVLLGMALYLEPYIKLLAPWQQFAALFAAACHDFNHPGTTNAHDIKISSRWAIRYHDESVLESHHLSCTFQILMQSRFNFCSHWSREMYMDFRKLVIQLVLLTDLSKHFNFVSRLKPLGEAGALQERLDAAVKDQDEGLPRGDIDNDLQLFLSAGIKMSDLGHTIKP